MINGSKSPLSSRMRLNAVGHALPYLIPDFCTATVIAMAVVFVELWAIAWMRTATWKPFWRAAFQVVVGGSLAFAAAF